MVAAGSLETFNLSNECVETILLLFRAAKAQLSRISVFQEVRRPHCIPKQETISKAGEFCRVFAGSIRGQSV